MHRPVSVSRAVLLWFIAVAAGVIETVLAVTELALESDLEGGIWISVAIRALIYSGAALLVVAFARGRRWARWCLVVLLSVVGMAAMVVPAIVQLAQGDPFLEAVASDGMLAIPFLVVRALHVAAVAAATVLMFTPSANRFFARR